MPRAHPHSDATYRIISLPGETFGVEVVVPDTYPAKVSGFVTEAAAEAWIANHKRHVQANSGVYRPFGKRLSHVR